MKICNACGRSISDDSLFCTFCGSKTDIMTNSENAATQENEESQGSAETLEVTETLEVNPAANPYMAPQSNYVQNPYMGQQPNQAANPYMARPNQPMAQPSYYAQTNMNMQARMMDYDKPLSLGEWLLTLIVIAIPFVNLIMLFIWAFGEGNTNRKNFSRAYLIYTLAIFVLAIVWIILMMVLGAAAYDGMYSYY